MLGLGDLLLSGGILTRAAALKLAPELRKQFLGLGPIEREALRAQARPYVEKIAPDLLDVLDMITKEPDPSEAQSGGLPDGNQLLDDAFLNDPALRQEIKDEVVKKYDEGAPYRLIADYIRREYGYALSLMTISRWVREAGEERWESIDELEAQITKLRQDLNKSEEERRVLVGQVEAARKEVLAMAEREYKYRIRFWVAVAGIPAVGIMIFLATGGLR